MKKEINIRSDLITPRVALSFISAFKSAYGMASFAADSVDFLGGELKAQIMPHLKNWAVEFELQRRCIEGIIPFECTFEANSRRNHKHIELRSNGFVLTVSQTHSINAIPRECVFRNDHNWDGQMALSGFDSDSSSAAKDVYAILTHGQGFLTPAFILCGIPNSDMTSWAQHENLFSLVAGMSAVDESPATEDIKLDFRDKAQAKVKNAQ